MNDFTTILNQAAIAYKNGSGEKPSPSILVNALLAAEKFTKQQRVDYPFESLVGEWRLCFVTGTRKVRQRGGIILGKGFYVPKFAAAYISFSTILAENLGRGEIGNQVQLGSISLKLTAKHNI